MSLADLDKVFKTPVDLETKGHLIQQALHIKFDPVGKTDTVVIAVSSAIFGFTFLMIIYAWVNRNYRPIRAKNLLWTTSIYLVSVIWFLGNIVASGHVVIAGAFAHCKFWILWLRMLFCFLFASMIVVRFYALDSVFNQNRPFSKRANLIAAACVVFPNVIFCLVAQFISAEKTVSQSTSLAVCDVNMSLRIATIVYQWMVWLGAVILTFRLRNIQSSFNEFYESLAVFVIATLMVIETSVANFVFKYYPLMKKARMEKTLVDTFATNVIIWLIIAQPIFNCLFNRRKYETEWLEKLTKDGRKKEYNVSSGQTGPSTAYTKMNNSHFLESQQNLSSSDGIDPAYYGNGNHYDATAFAGDSTLHNPEVYIDQDGIPVALCTNPHIHRPVINTSLAFNGVNDDNGEGRRVI